MSYLDENSAKQLLGMFDQLTPENQAAARIDLDAYEKSQHAAGKAMFPQFDLEQKSRCSGIVVDRREGAWGHCHKVCGDAGPEARCKEAPASSANDGRASK